MEELMRRDKMLVVADEAGNVWPPYGPVYKLRVHPHIQALTYRQIKLLTKSKYRPSFTRRLHQISLNTISKR